MDLVVLLSTRRVASVPQIFIAALQIVPPVLYILTFELLFHRVSVYDIIPDGDGSAVIRQKGHRQLPPHRKLCKVSMVSSFDCVMLIRLQAPEVPDRQWSGSPSGLSPTRRRTLAYCRDEYRCPASTHEIP